MSDQFGQLVGMQTFSNISYHPSILHHTGQMNKRPPFCPKSLNLHGANQMAETIIGAIDHVSSRLHEPKHTLRHFGKFLYTKIYMYMYAFHYNCVQGKSSAWWVLLARPNLSEPLPTPLLPDTCTSTIYMYVVLQMGTSVTMTAVELKWQPLYESEATTNSCQRKKQKILRYKL